MPLAEALSVLLGLLRDSGVPHRVAATGGNYQQSLAAGRSYLLLRVRIDPAEALVRDQRPPLDGARTPDAQDAEGRLKPSGSDSRLRADALCLTSP